jgi:hypothetical protein
LQSLVISNSYTGEEEREFERESHIEPESSREIKGQRGVRSKWKRRGNDMGEERTTQKKRVHVVHTVTSGTVAVEEREMVLNVLLRPT